MKKALIFTAIGIVIFTVCYFFVYPVGAQLIKTAPSCEPVIKFSVPVISGLMAISAVLKIYDLFYSRRKRW